jgi:AcrR family transcriptional regulator
VTELYLVAERLPRGQHGIPADLVRSHQRRRLLEAATAALAEQGYGRVTATRVTELARVSSRTFYQHFEDLWACLLAAYETEAWHLRGEIEGACKTDGSGAGVDAAISFCAAEPAVARLLCAEPPPQITALAAARRDLADTLAGMLRDALSGADPTPLPGLEHRLVAAAMALVATRAATGDEFRLHELKPELRKLLLASL